MQIEMKRVAQSRWVRWLFIGLLYVAAFMAVNPNMWDGKRFLGWDAVHEHWGAITYGAEYIRTGSLPLWCPHERGGYPFLADPQTGALYPVNLPFQLAVLLFGNSVWLILLHTLVHVVIAAVGMHYALQRLRLPSAARWLGGLSFVLSARFMKAKDTSWIWSAAWLPWIYIAADELARRPTKRAGVALGVVCGLCFTGGYVPNLYRNILGVAPMAILVALVAFREAGNGKAHLRRLWVGLGIAAAVFVGIALPGTLATLESFPLSIRGDMGLGDVLESPLEPRHAINLLVPGLARPLAFCYPYFGLAGALLAALACLRYHPRRVVWAVTAVVFFLLACGGNAFLLPALAKAVPIFQLWRVASNYLFITSFFLALLAAQGLGDLLEAAPEELAALRRRALVLAAVVLGVALSALVIAKVASSAPAPSSAPDPYLAQSAETALFLALFCGGALLALTSADLRARRVAAWLVVCMLVVDVGLQLKPVIDILEPKPVLTHDRQLARLQGIKRDVRLADARHFGYRVGMRHQVRELFGHWNLLALKRYKDYFERAIKNPDLLAAANVRYYAGRQLAVITNRAGKKARPMPGGLIELTEHAPFAFWTDHVRVLFGEQEVLDKMAAGEGKDRALVVGNDVDAELRARLRKLSSGSPGPEPRPPAGWSVAGTVEALEQNSLALAIRAPRPGIVVVNETFYPGWKATLNGEDARLFQVNHMFRGLLVPAGEHRIEMVYRPGKVLFGLAVFALTILALIVAGVRQRVRRRRAAG
jgi:hypothetical protein